MAAEGVPFSWPWNGGTFFANSELSWEMSDKNMKPVQPASSSPGQQTLSIQKIIDLAVQHHTAGRLPEAESIYQQILQADPNQPVALHLLGVIAHQVEKTTLPLIS